jgi:hypothetical protein
MDTRAWEETRQIKSFKQKHGVSLLIPSEADELSIRPDAHADC